MRMNKAAAQLFFEGWSQLVAVTCKRWMANVVRRRPPPPPSPTALKLKESTLRLVMVPLWISTGTRSNLEPMKGFGPAAGLVEVTYDRNLLGDRSLYLSSFWLITRGTCSMTFLIPAKTWCMCRNYSRRMSFLVRRKQKQNRRIKREYLITTLISEYDICNMNQR